MALGRSFVNDVNFPAGNFTFPQTHASAADRTASNLINYTQQLPTSPDGTSNPISIDGLPSGGGQLSWGFSWFINNTPQVWDLPTSWAISWTEQNSDSSVGYRVYIHRFNQSRNTIRDTIEITSSELTANSAARSFSAVDLSALNNPSGAAADDLLAVEFRAINNAPHGGNRQLDLLVSNSITVLSSSGVIQVDLPYSIEIWDQGSDLYLTDTTNSETFSSLPLTPDVQYVMQETPPTGKTLTTPSIAASGGTYTFLWVSPEGVPGNTTTVTSGYGLGLRIKSTSDNPGIRVQIYLGRIRGNNGAYTSILNSAPGNLITDIDLRTDCQTFVGFRTQSGAAWGGDATDRFAALLQITNNHSSAQTVDLELRQYSSSTPETGGGYGSSVPIIAGTAYVEVVNETEQISEQVNKLLQRFEFINETEQISEGALRVLTAVRAASDNQQITEAVQRVANFIRSSDDTEQIAESVATLYQFLRSIDDQVQVSEIIITVSGLVRFANETEQIAETVARVLSLFEHINETEQITEQAITAAIFFRTNSETEQITEALVRVLVANRIQSETEQIAEAVNSLLAATRITGSTETITESTLRLLGGTRTIDEVIQIADAVIALLGINRTTNETEQITEAVLTILAINRTNTELVNLVESAVTAAVFNRFTNETENVTEQIATMMGINRSILDTEQIGEQVLALANFRRIISETEQIAESVVSAIQSGGPQNYIRLINELQQIAEQVLATLAVKRQLSEIEEILESVYFRLRPIRRMRKHPTGPVTTEAAGRSITITRRHGGGGVPRGRNGNVN